MIDKKFFRYCFCGLSGVTLDFIFYFILCYFGIWYQLSNIIGYLGGTALSFYLNTKFTFRINDKKLIRLARFLLTGIMGLIISTIILYIYINLIKLDEFYSKLLSLPLVVIFQYSINKKYTFED
jgi:putative flippase GtrA